MSDTPGMTPHQADSTSFTVQPVAGSGDHDGGGAKAFTGGHGDATHPENWAADRSLPKLQELVRAAGIDPGDRTADELITLLKQNKPSNRNNPTGTDGPGAEAGRS